MTEDKQLPKMLFLDDRTKRIESALRQYAGVYDLTIVTNAKECLRYLCRDTYDIVSLDHDLGGIDFQDPDETTSGMEVVRYIVKCGGFPIIPTMTTKSPQVWIHSSNLFAATLMTDELIKVGVYALYKRFDYGEKKESANRSYPKHDWKMSHKLGGCFSCGTNKEVNDDYQCLECYIKEAVDAQNITLQDYWKMKRENKQ